jgi:hypothetical protein
VIIVALNGDFGTKKIFLNCWEFERTKFFKDFFFLEKSFQILKNILDFKIVFSKFINNLANTCWSCLYIMTIFFCNYQNYLLVT